MGGGGKGGDTHTTTTEPPEFMKPFIKRALNRGEKLYETRPIYNRDPNALMLEGLEAGTDVARNPMLVDPAAELAQQTIAGDFLSAPALEQASRGVLDDVIGGTRGAFNAAGMSGSGLHDYALGRGVTAALGDAYQRERGLQQQAMGLAPQIEAGRLQPAQGLLDLGQTEQAISDRYYREPWERYNYYTSTALGDAPAAIAGAQTTQPVYRPSPIQSLLGLGLTGAGVAGGLGWKPF